MPNPRGKNQLPGGKKELPYGGVQQAQQLTREAPMSGAPTSALNAPQRLQRQTVKGNRPKGGAAAKQPKVLERPKDAFHPTSAPPGGDLEPGPPDILSVWTDIAMIPGVTPLAQELAQRAKSGFGQ